MTHNATSRRSRPSMDDVAAAAGVSKGAVSKVIRNAYGVSPAMRDRVESAIASLGYRPRLAARVMRGASFTLGLEIPQLGNDFYTAVMEGVAAGLADSEYQLIIAPGLGHKKGAPVLNALVDRQVDGLIAISPEVAPAWLEKLGEEVPIVLLGRHDMSQNYDTLTNNDRQGSVLAMNHLFALGHEVIAHISVHPAREVPEQLLPHTIRRETYQELMHARGLQPRTVYSGPSEPDAHRVALDLLKVQNRPTAIFASNDTLAIGVLRARSELGLTAAELSVVGYDDIALAANPLVSLTTIDQFGFRSGEKAVELLMQRIRDNRDVAEHYVIQPELRIRDSTRSLPTINIRSAERRTPVQPQVNNTAQSRAG